MVDYIIENFNLDQISKSGQCFRMNKISENIYEIIAFSKVLQIEDLGGSCFRFYCDIDDFNNIWFEYFDLGTNYSSFISAIPKEDIFLKKASDFGYGIRILKQDPWEMIITFIISQRKNMPSIKKCVEMISQKYGRHLYDDKYAFPTPKELSMATVEELKNCSLGYRVSYIMKTTEAIKNGEIDPYSLYQLNNMELLDKLLSLNGVGTKVANCIMLFAYHRIDAFPIDVWISRILEKEYNNKFDTSLYKGFAGIMQQYMFYYATQFKNEINNKSA